MKSLILLVALGLCSCYRTDFSTSAQTAKVSGKTAAIHSWYFTGEKHVFITKIDGQEVRGTRKLTVDAGRRTIEVALNGFKLERGYTGGVATITGVLQGGHVYQIASGSSETRDQVFLKDVTAGGRTVASAPIAGR